MEQQQQERSFADDLIHSLMTPGYTAKGIISIMFYAFYALFATLGLMLIVTGGNLHVLALLILSISLFLAIRWFMAELEYLKSQEQAKDANDTTSTKEKQS
ncbi:hypothetical protein BC940DRAFT_330254 [Gongronella butleri]|nr:hypothetical protein BC940DRAFT_330254 [Gongronella butleri]